MQEANLSLMCVTVNNSSAASPAHSPHRQNICALRQNNEEGNIKVK